MRKNITIRGLAFLLSVVLVFSACGCGKNTEDDTLSTTEVVTELNSAQIRYNDLRLPYAKADSLDPYEAKSTMNRQLSTLMYDSLFTVGDSFEAKPLLAREYSADRMSITVSVNSNVMFSDRSIMTLEDIIYSFNIAKKSALYEAKLKNIESVSATSSDILLFTMKNPDPYAVACLDFPIIKYGTGYADRKEAERYAREEGEEEFKSTDKVVPTGSGRYVLKYEENETDPVLVAFNDRFKGFYPAMTTIHLVNVTDSSALFYSLEIGNISFAFDDLSGGKYTRVNADISEYLMNNLVYVGLNQDDSALAIPAVRRAISAAIDREDILNIAFQGHATITHTPFNPLWSASSEYETAKKEETRRSALEILEEAGFKQINSYGIRNNGRISLKFDLIVSDGNDFKKMTALRIQRALKLLNIQVQITEVPVEKYSDAVELGKFDMYIGEVCLSPNMNLEPFFGGSGAMAHGIWAKTSVEAYDSFLAGDINFNAFMEAFEQDVPFIPLCYRKGIVAAVKELKEANAACLGDLFEDIEEWHF